MQTQVDLKEMKNRLRERRIILMEQLDIESEKILPAGNDRRNKADLAYDYAYRGRQEAKLNRLESQVKEVDKALKRVKDGNYGTCTNCGKAINPERLEALPYVELCIECQHLESAA